MPEKKILLDKTDDTGAFKSLEKALKMSPEEVIKEIKDSGLRGRGGAGFPCGAKWEMASREKGEKILICNADEGEVGTFKDRYLLTHNPYLLLEGIAIAAYAISAKTAYIYLRAEYHYLLNDLLNAIEKAKDRFKDLEVIVQEGAGAYICGEESALMNSIEGKRGESRFKPPFPTQKGLFEKPTIINNVETLSNVPVIIEKGATWYNKLGTEQSKGTKLFCVSGDVQNPGVYELELGTSLKELMEMAGAQDIKMVQVGGSVGSIIPSDKIDTPLAFETALGSGAVMVFNSTRDVVDVVYRTVEFLNEESCGKCTPCREGTEVMLEVLGRLVNGEGMAEDLKTLENLGSVMKDAALCGLGQTVPVPILDTLKYYRKDYENRISQSVFLRSLKTVSG